MLECAAYGVPGEFGEHEVKLDVVVQGDLPLEDAARCGSRSSSRSSWSRATSSARDSFPKTPSERIEKYKLAAEPVDRPGVLDTEALSGR